MSLTWKEGVTTLAAAGAVLYSWAFYHDWTWSLVSSTRWMIGFMALATGIGYVFSYLLDRERTATWDGAANLIGAAVLVLTILGLGYVSSGYVITLMIGALVFWAAAMVRHLFEPSTTTLTHHPAT